MGASINDSDPFFSAADTYNLEVEGTHTFFVGKEHVWVHNACPIGRAGKQLRLLQLLGDDKAPSFVRGWIQQEVNAIARGTRTSIRVPPGMNLAHWRGFAARNGFDYSFSDLQDVVLHRIQHKIGGY